MSTFPLFTSHIDDVFGDPQWRSRHPHMHRRLIPLAMLDGIDIEEQTGPALLAQQAWERRIAQGTIPIVRVDLDSDDVAAVALTPGPTAQSRFGSVTLLAAARAAGAPSVWCLARYDSECVDDPAWLSRHRLTEC